MPGRSHKNIMRYPNLRYGNPAEFAFYARGIPIDDLSRQLRYAPGTLRSYLDGTEKMPWWIPELMRLQQWEARERMRQMNMPVMRKRLGLVSKTADILEFVPARKADTTGEEIEEESNIDHDGADTGVRLRR